MHNIVHYIILQHIQCTDFSVAPVYSHEMMKVLFVDNLITRNLSCLIKLSFLPR